MVVGDAAELLFHPYRAVCAGRCQAVAGANLARLDHREPKGGAYSSDGLVQPMPWTVYGAADFGEGLLAEDFGVSLACGGARALASLSESLCSGEVWDVVLECWEETGVFDFANH